MSASASSIRRRIAGGLAGLAIILGPDWALAANQLAQSEQPVDLLPATIDQEILPTETAPPATSETDIPGAPQGFEFETLGEVGTDYVGTLETDSGGLGIDMWRDSDRARIGRLLPRLRPVQSPVLSDLMRRLLLSSARAPVGVADGGSLVAVRAELLSSMGYANEALELLRLLPATQRDAADARLIADLSWRTYDIVGGCAEVGDAVARFGADIYWQQAQIFCQISAGKAAEAALGLDLLREDGSTDEIFYTLANAVAGSGAAPIDRLPVVNPLYLAMLRSAGGRLSDDIAQSLPNTEFALIAESEIAGPTVRLALGEIAAGAGALASQTLADIYEAQPADPTALDSMLEVPEAGDTPETRALLYQATRRGALPLIRAQHLQRALPTQLRAPEDWLRLRVFASELVELTPMPELAGFAPDAARALYALGRFDLAQGWLEIVEQSPEWRDSGVVWPSLLAFDHLAGGNRPVPLLELLLEAPTVDQGATPTASGARAARLQAIFDAFDDSIDLAGVATDGAVVASAAETIEMPQADLNLWLDLGDAVGGGRLGETVLLGLIGLQSQGLDQIEPAWIKRVLRGLQRVGLAPEARTLAIEMAIAGGL
ncbi:MAG: hypothetical protein ACREEE_16065 [Dongiaceae bacterium]